MRYDTEKIRSANPLSDWLDKYGVEVNRKGFAKCPFHSEKTASFRVYPDGTYHCFGCGAHGDVITFVMNIQNISFEDACGLLDRDISYSEQRKIDRARRKRSNETDIRERARKNYWNAFDIWKLNEEFIEFFKPSGPDEEPSKLFLHALKYRGALENRLNIAETEYIMRG